MTLSPPHCGSVAPLVRSCRPPPQAPHFPLPTFTNFSPFLFFYTWTTSPIPKMTLIWVTKKIFKNALKVQSLGHKRVANPPLLGMRP